MRLAFIGPLPIDDVLVFNATRMRVNVARHALARITPKTPINVSSAIRSARKSPFGQILFEMLGNPDNSAENHEVFAAYVGDGGILIPHMKLTAEYPHDLPMEQKLKENERLDGSWEGHRYFQDVIVRNIRSMIENLDAGYIHIDLGESLSCLYAAYACCSLREDVGISLGLHAGADGYFGLGGRSAWAQRYSLIRYHLAKNALVRADQVLVSMEQLAEIMATQLFPRIEKRYILDSMVRQEPARPSLASVN